MLHFSRIFFLSFILVGSPFSFLQGAEVSLNKPKLYKCPALSLEQVQKIYASGGSYDAFNEYIVLTKKKMSNKDIKSIKSVESHVVRLQLKGPYICQYKVLDKKGTIIDIIGLEKLD